MYKVPSLGVGHITSGSFVGANVHAAEKQSCILQVRVLKAIARD